MVEQRWESKAEKQTAQSAMGADTPRDLMERLAQLEVESTRMQTTLRMKERFLSIHELRLLGKSKVVTRENEGEREAVYRRSVQCSWNAQNLHTASKRNMVEQHWFLTLLSERDTLFTANHYHMPLILTSGRASALVQVGEPRNGLAAGRILA